MAALATVPDAAALDIQTGGGEVLATIPAAPPTLVATEGWAPNAEVARRNLAHFGADIVEIGEDEDFPFADSSFDLVTSRHPVRVRWDEVARVLKPGGNYLSQEIGHLTVIELTEFMMGPQPPNENRLPERAVAAAGAAGLRVTDLRTARLRMEFYDIAAVIVFLRKVIWTVPGFTVAGYLDRLREMHERITKDGVFIAHSTRFLIEATKPAS